MQCIRHNDTTLRSSNPRTFQTFTELVFDWQVRSLNKYIIKHAKQW